MPEKARLEITKGKREPKGLKDRGKVRLECADCGRALMEFQIVRNNADMVKLDGSPGPVTTIVLRAAQQRESGLYADHQSR